MNYIEQNSQLIIRYKKQVEKRNIEKINEKFKQINKEIFAKYILTKKHANNTHYFISFLTS